MFVMHTTESDWRRPLGKFALAILVVIIPLRCVDGQKSFRQCPTAIYGAVLFMRIVAYFTNVHYCQRRFGITFKKVLGRDRKGKASVILYATGIAASFWVHWIAQELYVLVALMWLIPDRRIERPAITDPVSHEFEHSLEEQYHE
jgi:uncharacterized membrane protein